MSAINRAGLGVMLILLIFAEMIGAEMGLVVTFIYGMITMTGFALFVYEKTRDGS